MTNPNEEALRIVRAGMTDEARQALAHLLNNAMAPVVMEADLLYLLPKDSLLGDAVANLRRVVKEVTR